MWIDTRERIPTTDGTFMVQSIMGDVKVYSYTVEKGWNTSRCSDGTISADYAIGDKYVVRWYEAEEPPEVPTEWFDEWANS